MQFAYIDILEETLWLHIMEIISHEWSGHKNKTQHNYNGDNIIIANRRTAFIVDDRYWIERVINSKRATYL